MPKRDKGEGTVKTRVFKKQDGPSYTRYFARIAVGRNSSGKIDYQDGPLRKSKAEANQDRKSLAQQLAQGTISSQGDMTLSAYMDFFLEQRKAHMSYKGYQAYATDTKNHIKPKLGDLKLRRLEPVKIQQWHSDLSSKSIYVARKSLACLSAALGQAVRWRLLPFNPCAGVVKTPAPKDEVQVWQPSECQKFLNVAKDDQFYLLFYIALNLGLRLGELRGLQWQDVTTKNGRMFLHIQRQNLTDTDTPTFADVKTKKSNRILPVPSDLQMLLEAELERQKALKEKLGSRYQDFDLVLITGHGTSPSTFRIREHFNDCITASKVPKIKFHALRHSAGSLWLEAGMSLTTVSARLGHGDVTVTARIYTHYFKEVVDQSGLTMADLLKGESKGVVLQKEKDAV